MSFLGCVQVEIFLFIWAGVKVWKYIIEGKIDGHNIPQLLKNKKDFYFKELSLLMCLGLICFMPEFVLF